MLVNSACALVPETAPLHALTTPFSESKMKFAGADPVSLWTTKSLVELNTIPLGAPFGMLTTSGTMLGMLSLTPPR